jgi:hypothetical protein
MKTEPLPGSLSTVTSPPIMRASLRVMARPSPVPPKRCADRLLVTIATALERLARSIANGRASEATFHAAVREFNEGQMMPKPVTQQQEQMTRPPTEAASLDSDLWRVVGGAKNVLAL